VDTSIETTMKANLINKRKRDEQVVNYWEEIISW